MNKVTAKELFSKPSDLIKCMYKGLKDQKKYGFEFDYPELWWNYRKKKLFGGLATATIAGYTDTDIRSYVHYPPDKRDLLEWFEGLFSNQSYSYMIEGKDTYTIKDENVKRIYNDITGYEITDCDRFCRLCGSVGGGVIHPLFYYYNIEFTNDLIPDGSPEYKPEKLGPHDWYQANWKITQYNWNSQIFKLKKYYEKLEVLNY